MGKPKRLQLQFRKDLVRELSRTEPAAIIAEAMERLWAPAMQKVGPWPEIDRLNAYKAALATLRGAVGATRVRRVIRLGEALVNTGAHDSGEERQAWLSLLRCARALADSAIRTVPVADARVIVDEGVGLSAVETVSRIAERFYSLLVMEVSRTPIEELGPDEYKGRGDRLPMNVSEDVFRVASQFRGRGLRDEVLELVVKAAADLKRLPPMGRREYYVGVLEAISINSPIEAPVFRFRSAFESDQVVHDLGRLQMDLQKLTVGLGDGWAATAPDSALTLAIISADCRKLLLKSAELDEQRFREKHRDAEYDEDGYLISPSKGIRCRSRSGQ